tara:strand:+ start:188 stop:559 length:372 start_codon:yes stop_codon:yes gene_type:complete
MEMTDDDREAFYEEARSNLSPTERSEFVDIRKKLESAILRNFHMKKVWFQERDMQWRGLAKISTDEWGVRVRFESENHRTLFLSGRWDVMLASPNYLGAQYCGWSITSECLYPEWESANLEEE